MTTTFKVRSIPYLLMSESAKKESRLADKIEEPFADNGQADAPNVSKSFAEYFELPSDHNLEAISGAKKSFEQYKNDNAKANPQIRLAAFNVNLAQKYLSSPITDSSGFNAIIYKETVNSIKNAFNALQKIGQQHNHTYLGDMIDQAKEKYHNYLKCCEKNTFISEPNEFKLFKSSDKNNLTNKFKDDTKGLNESSRSEAYANNMLANAATPKSGVDMHHVVIKRPNGKLKSIAGPFRSAEEAEAHPARKWGDAVAKGSMCENVSDAEGDVLEESRSYKTSKTFYNKAIGKYMKRKIPVKGTLEGDADADDNK